MDLRQKFSSNLLMWLFFNIQGIFPSFAAKNVSSLLALVIKKIWSKNSNNKKHYQRNTNFELWKINEK